MGSPPHGGYVRETKMEKYIIVAFTLRVECDLPKFFRGCVDFAEPWIEYRICTNFQPMLFCSVYVVFSPIRVRGGFV